MQFHLFIYSSQEARKPKQILILLEWSCQSCRCRAKGKFFKDTRCGRPFFLFNVRDFHERGSFVWSTVTAYIEEQIYSGTLIYKLRLSGDNHGIHQQTIFTLYLRSVSRQTQLWLGSRSVVMVVNNNNMTLSN